MTATHYKLELLCLISLAVLICSVSSITTENSKHPRALNLNFLSSIFRSDPLCKSPPDFPSPIPLRQETFKILRQKLEEVQLWTAVPRTSKELVIVTNWAYIYGYKIRPKDLMRSLSPFAVTKNMNCDEILIVDINQHLVDMKMEGANLVRVQTGAGILELLKFLEANDAGLPVVPVGGETTVAEAIAMGAFGTGVNPFGKRHSPFGTFSSLIMNFKAVVWDKSSEVYVIRSFERIDPQSVGFLTHLGRAFLTEVTLLVGPSYQLRCQTFSNFLSEHLFAGPNTAHAITEESLAYLVEEYGKVEVFFYPYVDRSWVKIWSKESNKPLGSLQVPKTFRSGSTSAIPNSITRFAMNFQRSFPSYTPIVSRFMFDLGAIRMRLSGTNDIWGTAQNTLYPFTNETQRYVGSGYAIITSRHRIQKVVSDFYGHFTLVLKQFHEQGSYPVNRPVRIRVSGLDSLSHIKTKGIVPPALSVLSPVENHSEFDVAIVIEINHRLGAQDFASHMESWFFRNYQGDYAVVRPLWSTEWGHNKKSAWVNDDVLKDLVPKSYADGWNKAVRVLEYYDPHKIFSNSFLDSFLSNGV